METPEDDRVIAAVRAIRDEYAALHGHDITAIFEDIRAAQEAAHRAYVRYVEPLADAIAPAASQLSTVIQQLTVSFGPVTEHLRELSEALAPHLTMGGPRLIADSRRLRHV